MTFGFIPLIIRSPPSFSSLHLLHIPFSGLIAILAYLSAHNQLCNIEYNNRPFSNFFPMYSIAYFVSSIPILLCYLISSCLLIFDMPQYFYVTMKPVDSVYIKEFNPVIFCLTINVKKDSNVITDYGCK
jgi:hypothetical protein